MRYITWNSAEPGIRAAPVPAGDEPPAAGGRTYPLACLIAIGSRAHGGRERPIHRDRAVGQTRRPGEPGPAARSTRPARRPVPAPDEKTIRVVLDRLDPRARARVLPGGRPDGRRGRGTAPSAGVRGYRARRAGPAGEDAGLRSAAGRAGGRKDLPRSPPCRRHPGAHARCRRTRRPPAGSPRGRRRA
jgi:hypothetical protein